jgi:hypothetical protein
MSRIKPEPLRRIGPDDRVLYQPVITEHGQPLVLLVDEAANEVISRMTPEECREHAAAMLESVEAAFGAAATAEADAFLVEFLQREAGLDVEQACEQLRQYHQNQKAGRLAANSKPN